MVLAEDVRKRAAELARSGRYADYVAIQETLDSEGYPEAYVVLSDIEFRRDLNRLCEEYRDSPAHIYRAVSQSARALERSYRLLRPVAVSHR
jgi:hypothetical protein